MKRLLNGLRLPLVTLLLLVLVLSAPSALFRTEEGLRLNPAAPFQLLDHLVNEVREGDFFRYTAGKTEHSILRTLPEALTISGLFLLAAGCVSLLLSISLAILIPKNNGFWREVTGLFSIIPDFLLVLILQISVVSLMRSTGISVARTAWISSSRPALLLPLIALSLLSSVYLTRIALVEREQLNWCGYIQFARARGIGEGRILLRHILPGIISAFKNELLKMLSIILGNLFIVEHLFNIPGVTRFMFRYVFLADNDYFSFERSLVTQVDVGLICLSLVMLLFMGAYGILRGGLSLALRGLQR